MCNSTECQRQRKVSLFQCSGEFSFMSPVPMATKWRLAMTREDWSGTEVGVVKLHVRFTGKFSMPKKKMNISLR
ncbi:hypothetical protein PAMP_012313 [Pampus punctatissimus]